MVFPPTRRRIYGGLATCGKQEIDKASPDVFFTFNIIRDVVHREHGE